jgi:C_GCAxxG_C_C family probable redox protein
MCKQAKDARDCYLQGLNCAQAVVSAFAEDAGLDAATLRRLATPFGGGIADRREMCGALTGMLMAAGLLSGRDYAAPPEEKAAYTARMNALIDRFTQRFGCTDCRDLLELAEDPANRREYCGGLVYDAAEILADDLAGR